MKQLIVIVITFLLLAAVSLLWDMEWVQVNVLRQIIVCLLFVAVLVIGYRFYNVVGNVPAGKR